MVIIGKGKKDIKLARRCQMPTKRVLPLISARSMRDIQARAYCKLVQVSQQLKATACFIYSLFFYHRRHCAMALRY